MQANHDTHIVQIALPVPLRRAFDYRVPAGEKPPQLGQLVLANFANRDMAGVVVGFGPSSELEATKIKNYQQTLPSKFKLPAELLTLCQWLSDYYLHPLGEVLQSSIPPYLRQGKALPENNYWQLSREGKGLNHDALKRSPKQQQILRYLLEHGYFDSEQRKQLDFSASTIKALEQKGLLERTDTEPEQKQAQARVSELLKQKALELNGEQQAAVDAVRFHHFACYLLHGATGSGKTEVYLQLSERALRAGQQVLVLVPEIGLSPQTVQRFRQRFNVPLIELHSGVSEAQRARNWLQALDGSAQIIIGTRLAALSPLKHAGLIIVDEEHDLAYKQQDGLRYSARDLSIYRANQLKIPIVLGSATPSLESLKQALDKKYHHLVLKQRASGSAAPLLQCLDLRDQNMHAGLSQAALGAIRSCLERGEQALVFQNRRGYAAVQLCHHCGWMSECPRCSASMTLHSRPARLHCHHCDWRSRVYQSCPNCQQSQLESRGVGTEQLEQALQQSFPETPVLRVDRDSSRSKKSFADKLAQVQSGQACVLVGTQMLAKGHHFPNLKLVIVTDADQGFFSSDFRGMERMGQLLMQVAGRAGREGSRGLVLLQSHRPDHPLLQLLCQRGYYSFARHLLSERLHNELPPYSFSAQFRAESKRAENASALLETLRSAYSRLYPPSQEHSLLGPMPSSMEKIQDRYRFQLSVKANKRSTLKSIVKALVDELEQSALSKRVRWSLDIDPLETA
ncbi:primosomal protein N' [Agaribacterium haliotis]|uniref:primosomal protein N' n=1 Tax=Agaribacterium haliotis TaxID=2013869 RepID=UPI000BB59B73|nr:primosomal protein N' [Agaribacterium haliotis]